MSELVFRSRPYVCGALGPASPAALSRLRAASPAGVREIARSAGVHLWASQDLERSDQGYYWAPAAAGDVPASWQAAAEDRLAAGLVITPGSAVLHTCALGLQELYTRRLGGAVYFATRIEPLLGLDDSPLHADEQAWASIIALGYPVGDATPFAEVRRMTAATAWQSTGDALSFEPRHLDQAGPAPTPAGLATMLAERLPRAPRFGSVHSTLSGGWDSRLLAGLLVRSGHRARAWTTSPDDGRDHDLELAGPVARALRMRHRVVVPDEQAWLREAEAVNRRTQYQVSMHTWLMPLARRLHRARGPLVDGLAGDVLLKGLFLDADVVDAPSARLWDALSRGRVSLPGMFTPAAAAGLEERSRAALATAVRPLGGHPAEATLGVLLNRTMRGVAVSPMLLFAPECDVHLPFVDPAVLRAALSVPERDKIGGGFYREVLDAAVGPSVGQLPSTNDPRAREPFGYRRQTSPEAVRWMAEIITADETVRRMLGPRMLGALENPDRLRSQSGVLAMLQAVTMFAAWRAEYADRLVSDAPLLSAAH